MSDFKYSDEVRFAEDILEKTGGKGDPNGSAQAESLLAIAKALERIERILGEISDAARR